MENLKNDIQRKMKIRKYAAMNTDDQSIYEFNPINCDIDDKLHNLQMQFMENIQEADQSKTHNLYFNISSNRKYIGRLIIFLKRAIRKIIKILFGWFINPILDRQTFFNGKMINSVNSMNSIMTIKMQQYDQKISEMESYISYLKEKQNFDIESGLVKDINYKLDYILNRLNVSCDLKMLQQDDMDYFKFENNFRGPSSGIKSIQSVYIPYFDRYKDGKVLDIGCGRGEFLELMRENDIPAYGIDCYEPFVDYCNSKGLEAVMADALTHISELGDESLDGIFMSQVVEHLSNDYTRKLITTAYKKLKPGAYFILETPNPDCLAAISEFNIDMSHIKPVHYKALEYLFKEANYQSVERYHTEQSMYPLKAMHIEGDGISNKDEFNQGIDYINSLLFGYRDYTLIAKK